MSSLKKSIAGRKRLSMLIPKHCGYVMSILVYSASLKAHSDKKNSVVSSILVREYVNMDGDFCINFFASSFGMILRSSVKKLSICRALSTIYLRSKFFDGVDRISFCVCSIVIPRTSLRSVTVAGSDAGLPTGNASVGWGGVHAESSRVRQTARDRRVSR